MTSGFRVKVIGTPIPKGSTKAFVPKGWTRAVITAANPKTKKWENVIRLSALEQWRSMNVAAFTATDGAWRVVIRFVMPRPKRLPSGRIVSHITKPDLDKLVRCVLDALTGVLWRDDSRVVSIRASKRYVRVDELPHVNIHAWGAA